MSDLQEERTYIDKDLERTYFVQLVLESRRLAGLLAEEQWLADNLAESISLLKATNPGLGIMEDKR